MILRKAWKIIVFPAFDPDQGYLSRIQGLQSDAVLDRNQPVARAVQDVNMTSDSLNPDVHPQMIAKHQVNRENGKKTLNYFCETVKWRVQDQETWMVVGRYLCCEAAAQASSIYDQVLFGVLFFQFRINELHIVEYFLFAALARTFSKYAVIHQHYVIAVAIEI